MILGRVSTIGGKRDRDVTYSLEEVASEVIEYRFEYERLDHRRSHTSVPFSPWARWDANFQFKEKVSYWHLTHPSNRGSISREVTTMQSTVTVLRSIP